MKASKQLGQKLAEFRRLIGKSQSQFAVMLGVSKHTIISVENGRNGISPKLAQRIRVATGAPIWGDGKLDHLKWWAEEKRFETWRQNFKSDEATALERFDELARWIRVVFRAAGRSGIAGNRDRLPALYISLVDWLEESRTTFKLEKEIDDILEQETRYLHHSMWADSQLKENPDLVKWIAGQLGISVTKLWQGVKAHKKADDLVILHAELEVRDSWDPEAREFPPKPTECKVNKLVPKRPKYWFETMGRPGKSKSNKTRKNSN